MSVCEVKSPILQVYRGALIHVHIKKKVMFKQNEIQTAAISENELAVRRSREECALIKLKGKICSLRLHRESEPGDIW